MKTYEIGQIFENTYEPEAAMWCNSNGAFITELESQNGKRRFQIQEVPKPALEEIKLQKIEALKQERTSREEAPVEFNGKLWDFDAKSRDRITAAITALEVSEIGEITWTAYDDTSFIMNIDDLKGIIASAAIRGDLLHKQYRILRDAVNAAITQEEVYSIKWE